MTNHCFVNTLDFLVLQGHRSFNAAVSDWYSESNGYSYNGGISGAGHFTQMVSRFGVSADNFMIVFALCTMGGLTRGTPSSTYQHAQSAGHIGLMITIHPSLAPTNSTRSCCLDFCLTGVEEHHSVGLRLLFLRWQPPLRLQLQPCWQLRGPCATERLPTTQLGVQCNAVAACFCIRCQFVHLLLQAAAPA